jgi:hypothetical protein
MRKKRNPKFKVEVIYKDVPDKKDRVRQLLGHTGFFT